MSLDHRTPSTARCANKAAANASASECKLDVQCAISMVSLRLDGAFKPFRSLGEGTRQCGKCQVCRFLGFYKLGAEEAKCTHSNLWFCSPKCPCTYIPRLALACPSKEGLAAVSES